MLIGIVLAGLALAAAAPVVFDAFASDEDTADDTAANPPGSEAATGSLLEAAAEAPPDGPVVPLSSTDGDAPDDPPPDPSSGSGAIAPTDPDARDDPGGPPLPDTPLAPADGDAPETDPGAGDGWIEATEWSIPLISEAPPADIEGFVPGDDLLVVEIGAEGADRPGEIDVGPSRDGADAELRLNGRVLALLRGAPQATLGDLVLSRRSG